jgi:hypothetical protein
MEMFDRMGYISQLAEHLATCTTPRLSHRQLGTHADNGMRCTWLERDPKEKRF